MTNSQYPNSPRDADIKLASRCLKGMASPIRLKILCVLGDQILSVQAIVEQVGTSQSNISQHLAILRGKGLVESKKEANQVFYFINDPRMLQLIKMMHQVFCPPPSPFDGNES